LEYGETSTKLRSTTNGEKFSERVSPEYLANSKFYRISRKSLEMLTGGAFGLYTLPNFRPEDSNKETTFNELKASLQIEFPKDSLLGYVYTSSQILTQQYVKACDQYLKQPKNFGRSLVVITKEPVYLESPTPGLKILNIRSMPFKLGQKLVKSADLPPLVTGDNSISLAMEASKPFFYALYEWKRLSVSKIFDEIIRMNPSLNGWQERSDLLKMLTLDFSGLNSSPKFFLEVFNNVDLQKKISTGLSRMSSRYSLPKLMKADLELFSIVNFDNGLWSSVEMIHRALRSGTPKNRLLEVFSRLALFRSNKVNIDTRVNAVWAIWALNRKTEPDRARIIGDIIKSADHQLWFAIQSKLVDLGSLAAPMVRSLITLNDSVLTTKLESTYVHLLEQDKYQYLTETREKKVQETIRLAGMKICGALLKKGMP
jgi:hypothetical protein